MGQLRGGFWQGWWPCVYFRFLSEKTETCSSQTPMKSTFPVIKLKAVNFHGRMLVCVTRVKQMDENLHGHRQWSLKFTSFLLFLHRYGQSTWQNKDECWGISSHVCDLTHETSDIQEPYYSRVRAALAGVYSSWSLSCRFTPWRESKCKHMCPLEGIWSSMAWNTSFLLTTCKHELSFSSHKAVCKEVSQ